MDPLGPKQRKWVEALRSGKYFQCRNELCTYHGNYESYCCLGVADKELSLRESSKFSLAHTYDVLTLHDDGGSFLKPINIYGKQFLSLINLNDFGISFKDIALIIENYWFLIFKERV